MVRELKFRAWDDTSRVMRFFASIFDNKRPSHGVSVGRIITMDMLHKVHIMQFTGLLDKKGTDIYDSDIVEVKTATYPEGKKYQIFWNKTAAGWDFTGGGAMFSESVSGLGEVIGNIHENPELLT